MKRLTLWKIPEGWNWDIQGFDLDIEKIAFLKECSQELKDIEDYLIHISEREEVK